MKCPMPDCPYVDGPLGGQSRCPCDYCPHGVLLAEIDEHWTACEECAADAGAEIAEQSVGH